MSENTHTNDRELTVTIIKQFSVVLSLAGLIYIWGFVYANGYYSAFHANWIKFDLPLLYIQFCGSIIAAYIICCCIVLTPLCLIPNKLKLRSIILFMVWSVATAFTLKKSYFDASSSDSTLMIYASISFILLTYCIVKHILNNNVNKSYSFFLIALCIVFFCIHLHSIPIFALQTAQEEIQNYKFNIVEKTSGAARIFLFTKNNLVYAVDVTDIKHPKVEILKHDDVKAIYPAEKLTKQP